MCLLYECHQNWRVGLQLQNRICHTSPLTFGHPAQCLTHILINKHDGNPQCCPAQLCLTYSIPAHETCGLYDKLVTGFVKRRKKCVITSAPCVCSGAHKPPLTKFASRAMKRQVTAYWTLTIVNFSSIIYQFKVLRSRWLSLTSGHLHIILTQYLIINNSLHLVVVGRVVVCVFIFTEFSI